MSSALHHCGPPGLLNSQRGCPVLEYKPMSERDLFDISLYKKEKDYNVQYTTSHEYKIPNISGRFMHNDLLLKKSSSWILKENFSSGAQHENDNWCFQIDDSYFLDTYQLFMYCDVVTDHDVNIRAICETSIVDNTGSEIHVGYRPEIYRGIQFVDVGRFKIKILGEEKDKFLPNDTLTVRVKLTIIDINEQLPGFPLIQLCGEPDLPNNFQELYMNRLNSGDSIFQVKNKEFVVHKQVIEMRCPKLLDNLILKGDQMDNDSSKILDVDYQVFQIILEHIYLDKVSNIDTCIVPLILMAHKYNLDSLKRKCEKKLSEEFLTIENAPVLYKLAKYLRSVQLIPYIKHFWNINASNTVISSTYIVNATFQS